MMNWHDGASNWVGWGLMTLMTLVFLGLVAWGLFTLSRTARQTERRQPPPPAPAPDDILDERFARGEIDDVEYQHRREMLRTGRPRTT